MHSHHHMRYQRGFGMGIGKFVFIVGAVYLGHAIYHRNHPCGCTCSSCSRCRNRWNHNRRSNYHEHDSQQYNDYEKWKRNENRDRPSKDEWDY